MNEELFRPAGLYDPIMMYKPEATSTGDSDATVVSRCSSMRSELVDLSTTEIVAKYGKTLSELGDEKAPRNRRIIFDMPVNGEYFRLASGITQGSINVPDAAPLTFPDIDEAFARNKETFKDKAKDARSFLADYLDRRAIMQYARDDPDSRLALSETHWAFKAELADPKHSLYQGGILHLASGGRLAPRTVGRGEKTRDEGKGEAGEHKPKEDKEADVACSALSATYDKYSKRYARGTVGAVKRLLREDVLYLMIVNRPSDAELVEARAAATQTKLPHHAQVYDGT
ncbi:hypothetical protein LTR17_019606 [Elasticomyces elasticus]|nr:hypothetical protein LTR17_019606 [Elasticomyces elasticus]